MNGISSCLGYARGMVEETKRETYEKNTIQLDGSAKVIGSMVFAYTYTKHLLPLNMAADLTPQNFIIPDQNAESISITEFADIENSMSNLRLLYI